MKAKQVKKLLRKSFAWWMRWTGLGYWNLTVTFKEKCKENPDRCGYCEVNWEYLKAHITFYVKPMKYFNPNTIEAVVLHELMHVFLNEMRAEGMDHEERVATQLQHAFSWVRGATK